MSTEPTGIIPRLDDIKDNTKIGEYTVIHKIGAGVNADVYRVRDKRKKEFAMRILSDGELDNEFEVEIMTNINHPNVMDAHHCFPYGDKTHTTYAIVMPFTWIGSILDWLGTSLQPRLLDATEERKFVYDMCSGLAHLHEHGILHLDLKPDNVFVFETTHMKTSKDDTMKESKSRHHVMTTRSMNHYIPKIGDFDLSLRAPYDKETDTYDVYTPFPSVDDPVAAVAYRPIELLRDLQPSQVRKISGAADVWSMAMIILWILSRFVVPDDTKSSKSIPQNTAIKQTDPVAVLVKAIRDEAICESYVTTHFQAQAIRPTLNRLLPSTLERRDEWIDLLMKMLIFDPQERIRAKDILLHPVFAIQQTD
jgi:serine/threonine protein kinase